MESENYLELGNEKLKEKHESLRMEVIEMLVKEYSNDTELGGQVRKFVNIKEKTKDNFNL